MILLATATTSLAEYDPGRAGNWVTSFEDGRYRFDYGPNIPVALSGWIEKQSWQAENAKMSLRFGPLFAETQGLKRQLSEIIAAPDSDLTVELRWPGGEFSKAAVSCSATLKEAHATSDNPKVYGYRMGCTTGNFIDTFGLKQALGRAANVEFRVLGFESFGHAPVWTGLMAEDAAQPDARFDRVDLETFQAWVDAYAFEPEDQVPASLQAGAPADMSDRMSGQILRYYHQELLDNRTKTTATVKWQCFAKMAPQLMAAASETSSNQSSSGAQWDKSLATVNRLITYNNAIEFEEPRPLTLSEFRGLCQSGASVSSLLTPGKHPRTGDPLTQLRTDRVITRLCRRAQRADQPVAAAARGSNDFDPRKVNWNNQDGSYRCIDFDAVAQMGKARCGELRASAEVCECVGDRLMDNKTGGDYALRRVKGVSQHIARCRIDNQ